MSLTGPKGEASAFLCPEHTDSLSVVIFFLSCTLLYGHAVWAPLIEYLFLLWYLDFSYRQNVSGSWLGLLVPCRVHGKSWLLIPLKCYIYINISKVKSVQQSPFSHGTQHLSHSALDTGTRQDIFHSTEIL